MPSDEQAFIDRAAATYTRDSAQDRAIRELVVRTFSPWLRSSMRGLQLGCSEGVDTALLSRKLDRLDVVEGCREFVEAGRQQALPNVAYHHALFENFTPPEGAAPYDAVFGIYVLEHVRETGAVLAAVKELLAPAGLFFAVVPNARALSRQLALHMGLIEDLKALTEHDAAHGHRRVYDRAAFNRDLEAAGFEIIAQGGIMLKILADFQLDQLYEKGILTPDHVEGLYKLGLEYPDLTGSLFAVCRAAESRNDEHGS
jgi:2-polyprenyl-3-methyl-5-hydroxy-6-metoxy-1,4-benzoquinol methylase